MMKTFTKITLAGLFACAVLHGGCAPAAKVMQINTYPTAEDAIRELGAGTLHAVVGDYAVMAYEARESAGQLQVTGAQFNKETLGIGVPKNAPGLKDAVTDALRRIMEDKTYSQTLIKWAIALGKVPPPEAPANVPAVADVPQLADGTLTVGVELSYPPMEFFDKEFGKEAGVDVELAGALAQALGVEVAFVDLPFDSLVDEVAAGKVDIALSTIAITDERAAKIDFIPYMSMGSGILVSAGNPHGIHSPEDLCGHPVGVQESAAQYAALQSQPCETGK